MVLVVVEDFVYVSERLRNETAGVLTAGGRAFGLGQAVAQPGTRYGPEDRSYRRSTCLRAPLSGSTQARATDSSHQMTVAPTCSSTTPPSWPMGSATLRRTSGSSSRQARARRARRPSRCVRSKKYLLAS